MQISQTNCLNTMNTNSPNVVSKKDLKVSLEFPEKMWPIEYRIMKNYHDFLSLHVPG